MQYLSSVRKKINKDIILTLLSIYFFVSAIVLIKESIFLIGEEQAQSFFGLVNDTPTGVLVGWFGTALIQSSGALDSITITLVSAGILKMSVAVGLILGAELGTTVITQLVSILGHMPRGKEVFRSSFLVAMLHYFYNLFTLLLFFDTEQYALTHPCFDEESLFIKPWKIRAYLERDIATRIPSHPHPSYSKAFNALQATLRTMNISPQPVDIHLLPTAATPFVTDTAIYAPCIDSSPSLIGTWQGIVTQGMILTCLSMKN